MHILFSTIQVIDQIPTVIYREQNYKTISSSFCNEIVAKHYTKKLKPAPYKILFQSPSLFVLSPGIRNRLSFKLISYYQLKTCNLYDNRAAH